MGEGGGCWLLASRPSNIRDRSAQTIDWCCNTIMKVVDQPFHLAQSHSILATGRLVPELSL